MSEFFASAPPADFFWWTAATGAVALAAFVGCFVFLHRTRLMEKLDLHETASLVRYAIRQGLVQP